MLNIREVQVAEYYSEYLRLTYLNALNQIYQEIKHDIWYFVNLYRSAKSAKIGIPHIINLLNIANNNLPSVQYKYKQLQREITALEDNKRSTARDFQNIIDEIVLIGNRLDSIHLECQNQVTHVHQLCQKRMKLDALVRQFENDNETYNNIRRTAEEKVADTLAGRKDLLRLAVFCVLESIKKDPDKYGPLIYYNDDGNPFSIPPTTISHIAAYYNRSSYTYSEAQQQQQNYLTKDSFRQCYIDMLREEAEQFFISLEKMLVDEVINECVYKTSVAAASLPTLRLESNNNNKQQHYEQNEPVPKDKQ